MHGDRRWFLAANVTACFLAATGPGLAAAAGPSADAAVASAVRRRLNEYAEAWNRGDADAVLAQYDTSLFAILGTRFMLYDEYTRGVAETLAGRDRPAFKLDIETVRALGPDYAAANGRAYTTFKDGREEKEFFTVIYWRAGDQWKLIYAHSAYF